MTTPRHPDTGRFVPPAPEDNREGLANIPPVFPGYPNTEAWLIAAHADDTGTVADSGAPLEHLTSGYADGAAPQTGG